MTRILALILGASLFAAVAVGAESAEGSKGAGGAGSAGNVGSAGSAGSAGGTETPADLLQRGLDQESTNPAAAEKIYQQIVDTAEADRPAQAEAYLLLAEHLARQGQKAKATDLLTRLTRDYSDQTQFTTRARAELAKLRPADAKGAPAIVSSTPEAFQNDIDPALDRIEVTFDQPMRDDSWSWTGGGENYPDLTGKSSYDPTRTICSVPVKLRPGKVYWIGVNSNVRHDFMSDKGIPADWYVILFATRSSDGKPTPIPQNLQRKAKQINERTGQSEKK